MEQKSDNIFEIGRLMANEYLHSPGKFSGRKSSFVFDLTRYAIYKRMDQMREEAADDDFDYMR